jgi:hypothetical protein
MANRPRGAARAPDRPAAGPGAAAPARRGGPGAIGGFLYQFLAAVEWAASAWLEVGGAREDAGPDTATMVLEPPDGGDARYSPRPVVPARAHA